MPADGAREDTSLDLVRLGREIVNGVTVGGVGDVLVDYRTGVEVGGYVAGDNPAILTPLP